MRDGIRCCFEIGNPVVKLPVYGGLKSLRKKKGRKSGGLKRTTFKCHYSSDEENPNVAFDVSDEDDTPIVEDVSKASTHPPECLKSPAETQAHVDSELKKDVTEVGDAVGGSGENERLKRGRSETVVSPERAACNAKRSKDDVTNNETCSRDSANSLVNGVLAEDSKVGL